MKKKNARSKKKPYWPPPEKLIKNEIHTLQAIMNNPGINEAQAEFSEFARIQYFRVKDNKNTNFSFNSWIYFTNPAVAKASIECLITRKSGNPESYDLLTYSFGLFRPDAATSSDYLIKKFHFDFTSTPDTGRPPLQPIFHLQSPGELSEMLRSKGIKDDHLEPSLSEPRMCCAPMTLALLTDFLLREFGGDRTSPLTKITKDDCWRRLIKKNEELVLKPYYRACSEFFVNRENKHPIEHNQLFTQEFVYGRV